MVLTVIFEDLDWTLLSKGVATHTWSVGKPVYDLEHADDTLLLGRTTTQLQLYLSELEQEAHLYGISLNQTKAEVLADLVSLHPELSSRTARDRNSSQISRVDDLVG